MLEYRPAGHYALGPTVVLAGAVTLTGRHASGYAALAYLDAILLFHG